MINVLKNKRKFVLRTGYREDKIRAFYDYIVEEQRFLIKWSSNEIKEVARIEKVKK